MGDGSVWWISCALGLFAVVAVRVVLDMRECPGACLCLGCTAACYLLATVVYSGRVHLVDSVVTAMLRTSLLLWGHFMLWFSFLVYARHVFRDAQGRLAPAGDSDRPRMNRLRRLARLGRRGRTNKTADQDEPVADHEGSSGGEPSPDRRERLGESRVADADASRGPAGPSDPRAAAAELPDPPSDDRQLPRPDDRPLSKAERRRLRKQLRRQRQAA
jgi:hypothetical protein